jgi:hypothetical protein
MRNNRVTLSREHVSEMFKAISGVRNLLKGLAPKSANASEIYAVMSNLAIIQANLTGTPRINSN